MTSENNSGMDRNLKNCLVQLDLLFHWLVAVENKHIEQDGAEMGSNFAKFKRYPEYNEFIKYACQAEEHFSTKNYNSCGNSCRFSLEAFTEYIYKKENLEIDSSFFVLDKTGVRVRDTKNPTGYKLTTGWLDAKISSSSFQEYFRKKNAFPTRTEKTLAAKFSHYEENFVYDAKGAVSILSMIYNLYAHCVDKKCFVGTPRFDVSLLENASPELIEPQLTIEVNGKEERIPQNNLLKAILSKKVSEDMIKENLSLINKTDVLGNTPLSLAVYNDDLDTVKMLWEKGADPNFYFRNGRVDFRESVYEEIAKEIAQKIPLAYRAWTDYIEAHRCIPLIIAIRKDNVEIMAFLIKHGAKTWDSCIDGGYSALKIPTECSTVLTCAFHYHAKKCIRYLLDKENFDINQKTVGGGVTPLMIAVESGTYVDKLLSKGARIDLLDNCDNSVFLHAVQNMRHDYELLEKLVDKAKLDLSEGDFKNLLNHAGLAGCPVSYMDKDEAELFLDRGADINAKNKMEIPCVVDVAYLNKELLPWFKEKGAKLDFKALFYASSWLNLKYAKKAVGYSKQFFAKVLPPAVDCELFTPNDLNFTVPIDNIPRISPLVDAILFPRAKVVQEAIEFGIEKSGKKFLSDAQLNELHDKYPVIKELSKNGPKLSSYLRVNEKYNELEKWLSEGVPTKKRNHLLTGLLRLFPFVPNNAFKNGSGSQKKITLEEVKKLPKVKLDFNIDMTLEDVHTAIASVKELSRDQRIALFERHSFIKQLEMRGIDLNDPEEIVKHYNPDWKKSSDEILAAIREIKDEIQYKDVEISPLDDALIAKNYEAAAVYLTKGVNVSELTKILLLSVHDVPKKDTSAWNKVVFALKLRKDIDFSDVLLRLCKNHPKADFDIAEEFINNGYNFYRFANYTLSGSWCETLASGISNCDYNLCEHRVKNEDGTYNESPSVEDVRERNNSLFLKTFGEASFQYVNLRLIKNAILFGANPRKQDEIYKSAFDYANENRIDKSVLKAKPFLQTGVICNIIPDKYDNTKIYCGLIKCNGIHYNFKKRLFDNNLQEVAYDDSYKGKAVVFVIQEDSKGPLPGIADLVTLTDS